MRSRICLEVRNTAEEKPAFADADALGFVCAKHIGNSEWRFVPWEDVSGNQRRYVHWTPGVLDKQAVPAYYETAKRMPTEADEVNGGVREGVRNPLGAM